MQPLSYTYQPSTNPANHRYGYQGEFAEKDRETGFNHFELRDYDSRIGRWFAPDPYHQFISPYTGMGNNPIFHIDPSGGRCPWSHYSTLLPIFEAMEQISRNRNAAHEYWLQNNTSGGQSMNMATGSGMVNATCTTSEGDVIWVEGYVQALEYTVIEGSNYRSHGGQLYYKQYYAWFQKKAFW
jgi:RHS repeat-associated protein